MPGQHHEQNGIPASTEFLVLWGRQTVKFPNVRLQFILERGSDLPKITLGVRAGSGLEPRVVLAP